MSVLYTLIRKINTNQSYWINNNHHTETVYMQYIDINVICDICGCIHTSSSISIAVFAFTACTSDTMKSHPRVPETLNLFGFGSEHWGDEGQVRRWCNGQRRLHLLHPIVSWKHLGVGHEARTFQFILVIKIKIIPYTLLSSIGRCYWYAPGLIWNIWIEIVYAVDSLF